MPTDSASHYAADDPSITSTQTGSANRPKPAAAPTATSPLSSASPTKQSAATAGTSASPPAAAGSTASNSSATRTCPATSAARSSAHGTAVIHRTRHRYQPMTLTADGRRLLDHLDRPDIRQLLHQQHGTARPAHHVRSAAGR